MVGLGGQRQRVDHHVTGTGGYGTPGVNVPAPNCANVWCRPSRQHDVVRRLRAAVEADHRVHRPGARRASPRRCPCRRRRSRGRRRRRPRRSSQPASTAAGRVASAAGHAVDASAARGPGRASGPAPSTPCRRRRSRRRSRSSQALVQVDGLLAEADGERDRLADRVEVVELDRRSGRAGRARSRAPRRRRRSGCRRGGCSRCPSGAVSSSTICRSGDVLARGRRRSGRRTSRAFTRGYASSSPMMNR